MEKKYIYYFDKPGKRNTDDAISVAKERVKEMGIKHVIVATNSGDTGVKVFESFKDIDINIVVVTLHAGRWPSYERTPDFNKLEMLKKKGVKVLTATHALIGNVEMAIRGKFGGVQPSELIGQTYFTICKGMKVAVEITLMAADANLIPVTEDVITITGTGYAGTPETSGGADTVVILKPSYTNKFFDIKIKEIVAMPRNKK